MSGTLTATASGIGVICEETIDIFRDNNCPQSINIVHVEQCADFMVSLTHTHQVDNVNWYYSIGPHSHVYFGSSTNTNGNGSINTPFYLNGSWDDYSVYLC